MAVRDWLKIIIGSGTGRDALPRAATLQPASPRAMARPGGSEAIAYAVNLTDLVLNQPNAMEFYQATYADHQKQPITYDDLRKRGDLLDKDALKALGLRANVKLSAQFLATLNERGRSDPLEAASVIGCTISTTLSTLRDLASMESAGIEVAEFHASDMAAGPCDAARRLHGHRLPIGAVEQLPFKSCPQPGQCACMYQSRLSLTGEF